MKKNADKKDKEIKIPKRCPGCSNHCSPDKLKCGKGKKIFAAYRKKMKEAEKKDKSKKKEAGREDLKAAILKLLASEGAVKPKALRKKLGVEKKAVKPLLKEMKKSGLIKETGEKGKIAIGDKAE